MVSYYDKLSYTPRGNKKMEPMNDAQIRFEAELDQFRSLNDNYLKEKLSDFATSPHWDTYKMISFFSYIRQLMELKDIKQKYNILNAYCNLALHPKISHIESVSAFFTIKDDIIKKIKDDSKGRINKEVTALFRFSKLIEQIDNFNKEFKIGFSFSSFKKKDIISLIISCIFYKPIKLEKKHRINENDDFQIGALMLHPEANGRFITKMEGVAHWTVILYNPRFISITGAVAI